LKDQRIVFGWMGLDSNDTPLVLRDYTFEDIYALTFDQ
jgi:hypothetical protein